MINHRSIISYDLVLASAVILGMAFSVWPSQAESSDFLLAQEGKPAATIVVAAAATNIVTSSARELQLHIEMITGAKLPIMNDNDPIDGLRILVGPSTATALLGLDESQFRDQEYLIRVLDNIVILLGKELATSYAVHDFLERCCDVRWYGPGELQTVVPQTSTLSLPAVEIRRRPAFAWRSMFPWTQFTMARELYGQPSDGDVEVFWQRVRMGGEAYACNHSFEGYFDRFWKQNPKRPELFVAAHPDWFAQGYSATEQEAFGKQPPQLCYSHPDLVKQVVADARKFFDGQGAAVGAEASGKYFAMVPMDWGGRGGWCKCTDCQSQIDQQRLIENRFDSNGSASDYWFGFVNKVAREIAKTHPDKYVSTLAYAGYSYYPRHVRLEPNISVQMCLHTRNWWAPGMRQDELRWYQDWVKHEKGRPLFVWLYYVLPEMTGAAEGFAIFPGFFAHTAGQQIKTFARDGIRGAFIEGVSDQVDTYVTAKLLDDPSLEIDDVLDKFFTQFYGRAAEPMKRFYLEVEKIYGNPANYPEDVQQNLIQDFFQTEEIAWKYLGTEARMAVLGSLMEEATRLAVGDVEKQRVDLFRRAIWNKMVEGRAKYLAKQ